MLKSNAFPKHAAAAFAAAVIGVVALCPALAFAGEQAHAEVAAPAVLSVAASDDQVTVSDDPIDISGATITVAGAPTYTGSAVEPAITVVCAGKTLVSGTDYTAAYSNNVNPGTATVTVTGAGGYMGTASTTFTIAKAQISSATITVAGTPTYTGSAIEPAITVVCADKTLVSGTDYTVAYSNNVNPGIATVTVTGAGNYMGTASTTFTIAKAQISSAIVSLAYKSTTYTGKALKPAATVAFGGKTLAKGADYKVAYANNKNAGTATVVITGMGANFTGTKSVAFTIKKAKISKATVTKIVKRAVYDAKVHLQTPVVKFNGKKLVKGTDYKIGYLNASKKTVKPSKVKNAGLYRVKLTGKGNFTGVKTITFRITKAKISAAKITKVKNFTYNGAARSQKPVVRFAGKKQKNGTAYTFTYLNSKKKAISASQVVDAGTYYVRFVGKGNFKGTKKVKFYVNPATIKNASVQGVLTKTYNGQPQTQNPTVKMNGKLLKEGTDYSLSYWNDANVNAGTAWLTITGTGNYKDYMYEEFDIRPAGISMANIAYPNRMKYTGKAIQPKPTLIVRRSTGDVLLRQGVDYEVGYRNNVRRGTGTMIISGTGNYDNTVIKTFTIY